MSFPRLIDGVVLAQFIELVVSAEVALDNSTTQNEEACRTGMFRFHHSTIEEIGSVAHAMRQEAAYIREHIDPSFVVVINALRITEHISHRRIEAMGPISGMRPGPGPANTLKFLARLDDHTKLLEGLFAGLVFVRSVEETFVK